MIKKKKFTWLGIAGILTLSVVLLLGNLSSAYSEGTTGKSSKYLAEEYNVQDSVIKTFNLDTNKVKPLFNRDVFDDDIATESSVIRAKLAAALVMLTDENTFIEGDFMPMFFLKGNDKASIAIKHADGTISLTEFDISKEKPVKTDHKIKEANK